MKLCVVLSVCVVLIVEVSCQQQGQQTEDNRVNGQQQQQQQQQQPCSAFQGCIQSPRVNFKVQKIRTIYGIKNAIIDFIPAKLQLEIDAIRGVQGLLNAKAAAKTGLKQSILAFNGFSNGVRNVFNNVFPQGRR